MTDLSPLAPELGEGTLYCCLPPPGYRECVRAAQGSPYTDYNHLGVGGGDEKLIGSFLRQTVATLNKRCITHSLRLLVWPLYSLLTLEAQFHFPETAFSYEQRPD